MVGIVTCGKVDWKILLDRHPSIQRRLIREIGDPKASGSEHAQEFVVSAEDVPSGSAASVLIWKAVPATRPFRTQWSAHF